MACTSGALPRLQTVYAGKYHDRNPDVRSAGILSTLDGNNVPQCMKTPAEPPVTDIIRRFRGTFQPEPGAETVFYGTAQDPHRKWAKETCHGVHVEPGLTAAVSLNPTPKSFYQQKFFNRLEAQYASNKRAPLGCIVDPQEKGMLPENINLKTATFGIKCEKIGSAGELLNPDLTPEQIQEIDRADHRIYLRTHRHFYPGEQARRMYDRTVFNPTVRFGQRTPHFNTGIQTKKAMTWMEEQQAKSTPLVAKRLDDFRERTQPQLGRVLDPIKDTMRVGPDHTFGILSHPDAYGVDDVLHGRAPKFFLRGKDRQRGLLNAVRQQLKKQNYQNFHDLYRTFQFYDKDGTGKITVQNLRDACVQFNLPIDLELMEQLVDYCDVDRDGTINWNEFANFLNWREPVPSSAPASVERQSLSFDVLEKQIDGAQDKWTTTNGMYNAASGRFDLRKFRTYGTPTIRSDKPIPKLRGVSDRTNYGDEGSAGTILQPSIYGSRGVYEVDMMRPRSKIEIQSIFEKTGVLLPPELLDTIYQEACDLDPHGEVCVEAFRIILDRYNRQKLQMESEASCTF